MTDLLYQIADFLEWTFVTFLEPLGNIPNTIFILIGFAAVFYWLYLQGRYNKEAKDNGTLI